MSVDPTLILVWSIVAAISAVALTAIVRALFRDQSRGRRRCPRCWHDMQQTPGLRCPECGSTVRNEARLFQTRRHWRQATFILIGLVIGATVVRVRMTDENLFEYAPTWFLTRSLPYSPTTRADPITEALQARMARKALTSEQIFEVARRIREGDAAARPTNLLWQARYGVLLETLVTQALDAQANGDEEDAALQVLDSFRDLPPVTTLTAPATWPVNEPLVVELAIDEWWPPMTYARVRIRDDSDGTERIMGLDSGNANAPRYPFSFAPLSADAATGPVQRSFTIIVEPRKTLPDGSRDDSQPWGIAHTSSFTLQIAAAKPLELTPLRSAEADDAIRSVFSQGLVAWRKGWRRYGLMFDSARTSEESFTGTLIGLDIELLQGASVRRHSRIWWPAGGGLSLSRWEIISEDAGPLAALTSDAEGWSVRVRGDRDVAVRALAALRTPAAASQTYTRYWDGEVTVPLRVRVNESAAPRRRWFALPESDWPQTSTPAPASSSVLENAEPSTRPPSTGG
jgi:hypothetical protein